MGEVVKMLMHDCRMNVIPGGGVGGGPHMKRSRMLVVPLRGVNQGFWSHLRRNAIIFSCQSIS